LSEPAAEITASLLTPCQVDVSAPGEIVLAAAPMAGERVSGEGQILYDADAFLPPRPRHNKVPGRFGLGQSMPGYKLSCRCYTRVAKYDIMTFKTALG
jgi:hypothetical protein